MLKKPNKFVLVIEDDRALLDALHDILETIGLKSLGSSNGRDGIDAYRTHQKNIQLVVLDLRMPDMDGTDVLKALRTINPRVKTLVSSGYDEKRIQKIFAGDPDVPIIRKPYDLNSFVAKVQGLIGN